MDPSAVLKGLKTRNFGRTLLCLERSGSTNDILKTLAGEGAPEGTLVLSEVQTGGRGRQGRSWASKGGKSLTFSILLRPRSGPGGPSLITLAAAVGAAQALEERGLRPSIKWPNDILLGGRKVCGILTELTGKGDKMAVVLGMGLNLNEERRDFPKELRAKATSLYLHRGKRADRVLFLQRLLVRLEGVYGWLAQGREGKVLEEWRERAETLGRWVKVVQGRRTFYGRALDLDGKGCLLVGRDGGAVERIHSGDIVHLMKDGG